MKKGIRPAALSPVAEGDESMRRTDSYARLAAQAKVLSNALPAESRDAFYETVLYPLRGAELMNDKVLFADRSLLYAAQGRASAGL